MYFHFTLYTQPSQHYSSVIILKTTQANRKKRPLYQKSTNKRFVTSDDRRELLSNLHLIIQKLFSSAEIT